MNIPRLLTVLLALACASPWTLAQDDLYVGEAVVESSRPGNPAPQPATGSDPILDALNQVLVRLTGRVGENVVAELGIDTQKASALALGRQFRRAEVPGAGGSMIVERRLRVDFDAEAIDRLIDESGLLRWGSERPELLLWIVVEGDRGAEYLEQDRILQHAIEELGFRYGIDLTRPILDASDRVEVTPADVRGGFTGVATAAMKRYGADGVIMLDLRPNGNFWTGRWAWRIDDQESAFQRSGAQPRDVMELGLGRIAEALAARFSVRPSGGHDQRLVISGIDTTAHYAEVKRFLESLTGVETVRVISAAESGMTFSIRSATDRLRQRIELTGPLEFRRHDLATDTLHYRFAL
ncbi:MAG TPA: DUF2066 domain-containing protein [Wenzhouxiangellaceae bacterium]|nr:DUF2066 domain-containing protein [Wenzhouxiangellaceae bacterium]